jgi:acetylglutamate kinase
MSSFLKKEPEKALAQATMIIDELPWIQRWVGKTIVIKYGGSAMEDKTMRDSIVSDIALLKLMGLRVVLVHGGGKRISSLMESLDIPVVFKNGMRVTDDAGMDAAQMVLVGKINEDLVTAFNHYGDFAVGVTGADARTLVAAQLDPELGRVGKIESVNAKYLSHLLSHGFIPIIASIAMGKGGSYNINADTAASKIAVALNAAKLVFLTDVDGLYTDFPDDESFVARLTLEQAREMMTSGTLSSGMIPKVAACVEAMEAGVERAHIINGTFPHSLLLEVFTDEDVGTLIYHEGDPLETRPKGSRPDDLDISVENFEMRER